MAAGLILALIMIAGLGIVALILICVGGLKKRRRQASTHGRPTAKKSSKRLSIKSAPVVSHQHKEPYISAADWPPAKHEANDETNAVAASLGFSALHDLLPEAADETNHKAAASIIMAPAEFNPTRKKKPADQDMLVLHVIAPVGQPFIGYELLQAVAGAGLRFGKMDIFHYYDDYDPNNILFSLCSAVEPGLFDITNMGALICPGLSLFMQISSVENPKAVFNLMLETARELAADLAGSLCDEKRRPLTDEKLHEYMHRTAESAILS